MTCQSQHFDLVSFVQLNEIFLKSQFYSTEIQSNPSLGHVFPIRFRQLNPSSLLDLTFRSIRRGVAAAARKMEPDSIQGAGIK